MNFIDFVQTASSVIVIISAIVAGIWTYYRFKKLREAKKALTVTMTSVIHADNKSKCSIVEVSIELRSTGTVPIFVDYPHHKKCTLEVKTLPILDADSFIGWNDNRLQPMFEPIEYLQGYDLKEDEKLIFEPGVSCEVEGYAVFSTQHQGLLLLHARFRDNEDIEWHDWAIINTKPEVHKTVS